LHGNYEEARELYQTAPKNPISMTRPSSVGVVLGESQGEYDKALEVVDVALKEQPKSADLLGRRAEVSTFGGAGRGRESRQPQLSN